MSIPSRHIAPLPHQTYLATLLNLSFRIAESGVQPLDPANPGRSLASRPCWLSNISAPLVTATRLFKLFMFCSSCSESSGVSGITSELEPLGGENPRGVTRPADPSYFPDPRRRPQSF